MFLLTFPITKIESIGKNVRNLVINNHTWKNRVNKIIEDLNL